MLQLKTHEFTSTWYWSRYHVIQHWFLKFQSRLVLINKKKSKNQSSLTIILGHCDVLRANHSMLNIAIWMPIPVNNDVQIKTFQTALLPRGINKQMTVKQNKINI